MSHALPPSIGTGFTGSQYAPDYVDMLSKEKLNEMNTRNPVQNSPVQPGVVLAKDGLDVWINESGITNVKGEPARPSLATINKTLITSYPNLPEDKSITHYHNLRSGLPDDLKGQLTDDEEKTFEERDPNLIAMDANKRLNANWMAMAEGLSVPSSKDEPISTATKAFNAMPETVGNNMLHHGAKIGHHLDHYLSTIRSDTPGFDILLNASNQIKDAGTILGH